MHDKDLAKISEESRWDPIGKYQHTFEFLGPIMPEVWWRRWALPNEISFGNPEKTFGF